MPDVEIPSPFEAYLGDRPYIFVAYAHADAGRVYPILKLLHNHGYRIWYDEGIDPGNEWPEDVAHRLTSCAAFIVFISPQAVQSKNVRNEINFALTRPVPFLAVHIERTELPPGLQLQIGSMQAILLHRMNSDTVTRKLLASLDPSLTDSKNISPAGIRAEPFLEMSLAGPVTKETLRHLSAIARARDLASLSRAQDTLKSEAGPVVEKAVSRFIEWLHRYSHHKGYSDIGEALWIWLTADSGAYQVGEDWDMFLRVVASLLASPALQLGLKVTIEDQSTQSMRLLGVPETDAWLRFIDNSSFKVAVLENRQRHKKD